MDNGKELSRETLGMMFILGGIGVFAVGLILYTLIEEYPLLAVYLLSALAVIDILVGILITYGVIFKNFRSKSEILSRPR